jgi:hypothetical protein
MVAMHEAFLANGGAAVVRRRTVLSDRGDDAARRVLTQQLGAELSRKLAEIHALLGADVRLTLIARVPGTPAKDQIVSEDEDTQAPAQALSSLIAGPHREVYDVFSALQ